MRLLSFLLDISKGIVIPVNCQLNNHHNSSSYRRQSTRWQGSYDQGADWYADQTNIRHIPDIPNILNNLQLYCILVCMPSTIQERDYILPQNVLLHTYTSEIKNCDAMTCFKLLLVQVSTNGSSQLPTPTLEYNSQCQTLFINSSPITLLLFQ